MTLEELELRSLNVSLLGADQLNALLTPIKTSVKKRETLVVTRIDVADDEDLVGIDLEAKESIEKLIEEELLPKEETPVVVPEVADVEPPAEKTPEEEPEKTIPIEEEIPEEKEPKVVDEKILEEKVPEEEPVEILKLEKEESEKPPEIVLKEDYQVIEKLEIPKKNDNKEISKENKKKVKSEKKKILNADRQEQAQAKKEIQKQIEQKKRKRVIQKSKLLVKSWNLDLAKQRTKTDQSGKSPAKSWKGLSAVKTIVSANKKIFSKTLLRGKWKNPVMSPVLLRRYLPIVNEAIKPYWNVPVELDPTLQVLIKALVAKDGRILSVEPVETSGSKLFDQAVKKVFVKLVQLPPLPEAFPGEFTEIGLRFKSSQ